jgi:anti-sigma factor RsiW
LSNVEHIREENLELLALGALPEEEAAAANAHAAGCTECAKKLAAARGRAAALAFGLTQEKPAAAAKQRLFARIALEREGKSDEASKSEGRRKKEELVELGIGAIGGRSDAGEPGIVERERATGS